MHITYYKDLQYEDIKVVKIIYFNPGNYHRH